MCLFDCQFAVSLPCISIDVIAVSCIRFLKLLLIKFLPAAYFDVSFKFRFDAWICILYRFITFRVLCYRWHLCDLALRVNLAFYSWIDTKVIYYLQIIIDLRCLLNWFQRSIPCTCIEVAIYHRPWFFLYSFGAFWAYTELSACFLQKFSLLFNWLKLSLNRFKLVLTAVSAELRRVHLSLFASDKEFALWSNSRLGSLFCQMGLIYVFVHLCSHNLRLISLNSCFSKQFSILVFVFCIHIQTRSSLTLSRITDSLEMLTCRHSAFGSLLS